MSNWVISLLFTVGASTWIYAKFMRRTGSNTKTSVIVTIVIGAAILLVSYLLLSLVWDE